MTIEELKQPWACQLELWQTCSSGKKGHHQKPLDSFFNAWTDKLFRHSGSLTSFGKSAGKKKSLAPLEMCTDLLAWFKGRETGNSTLVLCDFSAREHKKNCKSHLHVLLDYWQLQIFDKNVPFGPCILYTFKLPSCRGHFFPHSVLSVTQPLSIAKDYGAY